MNRTSKILDLLTLGIQHFIGVSQYFTIIYIVKDKHLNLKNIFQQVFFVKDPSELVHFAPSPHYTRCMKEFQCLVGIHACAVGQEQITCLRKKNINVECG